MASQQSLPTPPVNSTQRVVTNGRLTEEEFNTFIQKKIISMKPESSEDPFYVLNLEVVRNLMHEWNSNFPNIRPFYAVKCNPEPTLVASLAKLGAGFDCASRSEIELVLGLGVSTDRIVFANTCKPITHIRYAASVGVDVATFDSHCEIEKIKKWHPRCSVILRIQAGNDTTARRPLCTKFGALPDEVVPLLEAARNAALPVIGVSFHVGSAVTKPEAYNTAIASAKFVFDAALQLGMPKLQILDIGGGFTAGTTIFDDAVLEIKDGLQSHFPNEPDLKVIAEPGRFFADKSFSLVANITGKRVRGNLREYWINDGVFGTMIVMLQERTRDMGAVYPLACESDPNNPTCRGRETYLSVVYGPTCDSLDTVLTNYQLPDLELDDRLVFMDIGAYTAAVGSKFNGFDTSGILTYPFGKLGPEQR